MLRFIALFADPLNTEHYAQVQGITRLLRAQAAWQPLHESNAFMLWSTSPLAGGVATLAARRVFVLGTLFERLEDTETPRTPLRANVTREQAQALAQTSAASLARDYWGDYVAFAHDMAANTTRIIKDPTGSLPCYLTHWRGVRIAFSHIEDCLSLGVPGFRIDRTWLLDRVVTGGVNQLLNPLSEVTAVARGHWIDIRHQHPGIAAQGCGWQPQSFAQRALALEAPDAAAARLRATLEACTAAWSREHPLRLLRLSGGLDSSIIAACLAPLPVRTAAYTYYDQTACVDERPWARAVASHVQMAHEEIALDPEHLNLATLERLHASVEPFSGAQYVDRAPTERRLCGDYGATAVFTGLGGDSVFGGDAIASAASEYLYYHGPRPEWLRVAAHVARRTQLSFAKVLARSLRRAVRGGRLTDLLGTLREGSTLLHPDLLISLPRHGYPHPWFAQQSRIRWPIVRRLGALLTSPHYYWADAAAQDDAPLIISPLYAQPVVELCLRIPLHVHFLGGRERGLARSAFATRLPPQVVQRQWKDRAPGYFERVMRANLGYLRERLLDGMLVREHLLDRAALERALTLAPSHHATLPGELLRHLDTELWARHFRL
jgi:asparagine synthase (glutamine-hydrolysing)